MTYDPLNHSVVQACLKADGYQKFECPEYVEALLAHIHRHLETAYWNVNQKKLEEHEREFLDIPGFAYRRYFWDDCDCGADSGYHLETCSPQLPNLSCGPVQVSWYKYMGRGMSVNVEWNESQWRIWFDDVLALIEAYNHARRSSAFPLLSPCRLKEITAKETSARQRLGLEAPALQGRLF